MRCGRRELPMDVCARSRKPKRPSASRVNSSKIRREKIKTGLESALKAEDQGDLLDTLWKVGIRNPRQLADIEFEDASDEGITKTQFKVLQRIGREHSALSWPTAPPRRSGGSSNGNAPSTLPPPTPGYETSKC